MLNYQEQAGCKARAYAGGTGDKLALPYLLSCLKHKHLSAAASNAIYSIFLWHPNPEITALMNQACSLVHTRDAAIPLLDKVIEQEPEYYEASNCVLINYIRPHLCIV